MAKGRSVATVLQRWRKAAGLNLDEAAVHLSAVVGRRISRESVRRYETGRGPRELDPVILVGLAQVYSADLTDLPKDVVEHIKKARDLLSRSPGCLTGVRAA